MMKKRKKGFLVELLVFFLFTHLPLLLFSLSLISLSESLFAVIEKKKKGKQVGNAGSEGAKNICFFG